MIRRLIQLVHGQPDEPDFSPTLIVDPRTGEPPMQAEFDQAQHARVAAAYIAGCIGVVAVSAAVLLSALAPSF